MDLKDYKRVSSGSEFRDVVQTSDTEPRFRSNGHQLEFNSGNSDYLTIPYNSSTTIDQYNVKILYDVDSFQGITGYLFCKGFTDDQNDFLGSYISSTGNLVLRINGSDRTLIGFISLYSGVVDIEFKGSSTSDCEIYINGELKISNPNRPNLQENDLLYINCLNPRNFLNTSTILGIEFQGESFNFTNINSNGQIEGSNGTIAQVNSSAADPINYILGTVFQKRGFALAFDAGNSEYVEIETINSFTTINNFEFNIDLEINNDIGNDYYFVINTSGLRFRIRTGASFFVVVFLGLSLGEQTYSSPTLSGLNKVNLSISNGVLTYNGVAVKTFNNDDISQLNNKRILVGTNGGALFNNGKLYSVSIQNESYDLKRGLGVELIGSNGTTAEIKTSAANPQQRVNFGMWQKNGNVLKFNADNSDYVKSDDFTFENGTSIKLNIEGDFGSAFFPFSNEGLINNFILLTPSQFQIRFGSGASNYLQTGLVIPTSGEYEFLYNNDTVSLIVNGVNIFDLATSGESMILNTLNSRATGSQSTINLNSFELGSETFLFREGNGLTTTSESGNTTATINTSAANPTEYIDTYVWNKDN
ncbi:MAG: hypothetical protein GY822_27540, partial [Deltaproteobacteria bacterium]|nr:hypothetical protein [Deltaproteobacteria bacterium]